MASDLYLPIGHRTAYRRIDLAVRYVERYGYVHARHALAVAVYDGLVEFIGHLVLPAAPSVRPELVLLLVPLPRGAGRTAFGYGVALGHPCVAAALAREHPRLRVPMVRTALGTALRVAVVGTPLVTAAFACKIQIRHVPFYGTAPGTPLGEFPTPGHPGVITS